MVLSRVGGRYRLWTDTGELEATLRGRMKRESAGERVLVGDRVRAARHADGSVTVESILPRRSVLRRRSPGRGRGVRQIAANLDQVIVVGAARHPDWDDCLMDRFVAVAAANDLPAVVVINKADLDDNADRRGRPCQAAGYPVLITSALAGTGVDALGERLAGHVSLFTGPTGVGKSSLLNAVQPGLSLRTAEVSRRSRGGRHTTVSAEMHPLREGGFVVDTPGLRDVGLWGLEPADVVNAFPEIVDLAGRCRFDNCRHLREPGCAVTAGVEGGDVSSSRYNSYRILLAEAEEAARPWA